MEYRASKSRDKPVSGMCGSIALLNPTKPRMRVFNFQREHSERNGTGVGHSDTSRPRAQSQRVAVVGNWELSTSNARAQHTHTHTYPLFCRASHRWFEWDLCARLPYVRPVEAFWHPGVFGWVRHIHAEGVELPLLPCERPVEAFSHPGVFGWVRHFHAEGVAELLPWPLQPFLRTDFSIDVKGSLGSVSFGNMSLFAILLTLD